MEFFLRLCLKIEMSSMHSIYAFQIRSRNIYFPSKLVQKYISLLELVQILELCVGVTGVLYHTAFVLYVSLFVLLFICYNIISSQCYDIIMKTLLLAPTRLTDLYNNSLSYTECLHFSDPARSSIRSNIFVQFLVDQKASSITLCTVYTNLESYP
jgi:hypothetical protein